jgi:hypothetical protein
MCENMVAVLLVEDRPDNAALALRVRKKNRPSPRHLAMAHPAAEFLTPIEVMVSLNNSLFIVTMRHSLPGKRTADGIRRLCLRYRHDDFANRNDAINGNRQGLSTRVDSNTLFHRYHPPAHARWDSRA